MAASVLARLLITASVSGRSAPSARRYHQPPRWLAEPEIAAGRLVEKELADPRPIIPLHIAWRSRQPGKALTWFLAELEKPEEIAALAAGL